VGPAGRDGLVDGIRGLALCGVVVVNTLSFPHVFSSPVGVVEPVDSLLALLVQAFCVVLFQAKSYPLLMFLVGYGWAMRTRRAGRNPPAVVFTARRRQMLRQGGLGVLHGLFIYCGDILSWLAVLGLLLLGTSRWRLRRLRLHCAAWALLWLVVGTATFAAMLFVSPELPVSPHWLTRASTWPEVFELNRMGYASYFYQLPWQLPMMLAMGTFGMLAGRLRLLERARSGARLWSFGARWLLPAGLERIRRKLAGSADGDRQMVAILAAVLGDGLPAVEAASLEALREGVHSADVVLNILARQREPAAPLTIMTPDALLLRYAPEADCARYDTLRRIV
jgi:uncharacterized membrane protein YeiB